MWRTWGVACFENGRAVGVRGHHRLKLQARREARAVRRRLGQKGYADVAGRIDVVRRSSPLSADWGADFAQLAAAARRPAPASGSRPAPVSPPDSAPVDKPVAPRARPKKRPASPARIEGTTTPTEETVDLRDPQPQTRTPPGRKATVRRHEG